MVWDDGQPKVRQAVVLHPSGCGYIDGALTLPGSGFADPRLGPALISIDEDDVADEIIEFELSGTGVVGRIGDVKARVLVRGDIGEPVFGKMLGGGEICE